MTNLKVIISILLFLLSPKIYSQEQKVDSEIQIVTEMVIGNDGVQNFSKETSFARPDHVVLDNSGNIYVADTGTMNIRVFDSDGEYLRTIGNRGRGPGEFLTISLMFFNNKQELLVFDGMQLRVTKFNTEGEVIKTFLTQKESQIINYFVHVQSYGDEQYLALYKKWSGGRFSPSESDALFHVWDTEIQNELFSFGSFDQLGYTGFGKRFLRSKVGSYIQISENEFLLAPYLYEGKLYKYNKTDNHSGYSKVISGSNVEVESYENLENGNNPFSIRSVSSSDGEIFGKVNVVSGGIFQLINENLIHFYFVFDEESSSEEKQIWSLYIEMFDSNYDRIENQKVATFSNINYFQQYFKIKDSQDRFYTITEEDEVPVVKVYSLDLDM